MEFYAAVRRSVYVEGLSERAAARRFGLARETVRKMLRYRLPPGYRRAKPIRCPKLDAFTGVIDQILTDDQQRPKKQRHTAKRIWERLCVEHAFTGGYTIVKDYVRRQKLGGQEMFVPLAHPPGDAQADFGEALVVIDGVECKAHYLVVDLPHSDDAFVQAFPAETTEAFCEGHNAAFRYFGGVPRGIVYDNTTLAVAKILGDGTRQRTQSFSELHSHYLFDDRFGRPGKGNDKGKVEGLVGYARRNFFVPVPRVASWDALNADLARQCRARRGQRLRRHTETIGERFARDRAALLPLPPVPYEACDSRPTRVTSLSLVRYRRNDYSVPTAYGHRDVVVKGYVDVVVIVCGSEEIARHRRSYGREELIFDPLHYLALLERKTGALDQAAPLTGLGAARRVSPAAAALGDPAGQSRDPRVCAGLAAPRGLSAGPRPRRYPGRPATGRDRVRRRQASRSVPPRPPAAPPRPGAVSASPGPAGDDDHGGRLLDAAGGRGRVMAKSTLLLDAHLKALRLPTFLREYDKVARHCAQEGLDCPRYLFRLCELELLDREQRAIERRIKAAKFPVVKSLETFAFRAIPSLNKRLVLELTRAEYLDRRENVLALGNSGTGKTHLALALGLAACQKSYRVRFTTAAALVNELLEARDDKRLLRFQKQLAKQDLLIVDELGYVPLSKTGAELLFETFSQRYEQASTLVTSNLPFNEWTEIFGSERLTGALLDRLTHHVHILELNGDSYRLAHSKHARKDAAAPAS